MRYDPFARGPFPVGVRGGDLVDSRRGGRHLPYEVWYPAEAKSGSRQHPLVLYSHASGGHRGQATFLCTHLASHGYVVGAVDHTGNTAVDFTERMRRRAEGRVPTEAEAAAYLDQIIGDRVPDIRFLADELLGGGLSPLIDPERVGLVGWSFGGWAVLATLEADDRFSAVVACAPAGTSKPLPGIIPAKLSYDWKREVPTLILAAEKDRFVTLDGVREIFDRIRSPKRMFVLAGADHQHFADDVEPEGDRSREDAHRFTRALTLSHLDHALKGDAAGEAFLERGATEALGRMAVRGT